MAKTVIKEQVDVMVLFYFIYFLLSFIFFFFLFLSIYASLNSIQSQNMYAELCWTTNLAYVVFSYIIGSHSQQNGRYYLLIVTSTTTTKKIEKKQICIDAQGFRAKEKGLGYCHLKPYLALLLLLLLFFSTFIP